MFSARAVPHLYHCFSSSTMSAASSVVSSPPTPIQMGVGLSDPALSRSRRKMLDLMNRLSNTGVGSDMDLPTIAVIGSQSAGKSSLIEAISGITLPRATGTCTRCPTECRLSYSARPWRCVVSLKYSYDSRGQALGKPTIVQFGPEITEKSGVEDRIRRAQRAILSPGVNVDDFLSDDNYDARQTSLTFSRNTIELTISGPDLADLSFVDLPGLIATAGQGGNTGDIDMVESLVKSWIDRPSCIILLTVACETDFMNQKAHRLTEEFDPKGKRTIGVLTKPDRIDHGEEESWLKFIRGDFQPLANGWFCVKQPSPTEVREGITWTQAREREDGFFSTQQPWASLDGVYQRQLRTSNLTERLSLVLSDLIARRLPEIQEELQRLIDTTENKLRKLPRPPSNDPVGEVLRMIGDFNRLIQRHVEGTPYPDGLLQQIRPAQIEFKISIRNTAPDFRPYKRTDTSRTAPPPPSFLATEEQLESASAGSTVSAVSESNNSSAIYIEEVLQCARDARTRELPDNYPFIVQEMYIKTITQKWQAPMKILLGHIFAQVSAHVKNIVSERFSAFSNGGLQQRVMLLINDHLKTRMEKTSERLEWLLQLEERPYTLNDHYYRDYRDKFLAHYKNHRMEGEHQQFLSLLKFPGPPPGTVLASNSPYVQAQQTLSSVLSGLASLGIHGVTKDSLPKLLPPDGYEDALRIMADVRAYFQVAYKRFTDNVPLAIDHELVRGLVSDLEGVLFTGLGISGKNSYQACKELLQEHPTTSAQREELQNKLQRLASAKLELVSIGI